MFTSVLPATTNRHPRLGGETSGARTLSPATVASGALIASALGGRALAWTAGGATFGQLLALLVIASLAAFVGHRAMVGATFGTLDARLARLAFRAGGVQTVLAVATVVLAIR